MINGDRCTRACGFCLVDTRRPLPADPEEPNRVAEAVSQDEARTRGRHRCCSRRSGGRRSSGIRRNRDCDPAALSRNVGRVARSPDCKGDARSTRHHLLGAAGRPESQSRDGCDVCSAPSDPLPATPAASRYSPRADKAGLVTKSGMILGMGETRRRGQRSVWRICGPSAWRSSRSASTYGRAPCILRSARYLRPEEFEQLGDYAWSLGFEHVESSPLTRSSYHARRAMESATASLTGSATGPERVGG